MIYTTIPERHQIVKNQGFKLLSQKKRKKRNDFNIGTILSFKPSLSFPISKVSELL